MIWNCSRQTTVLCFQMTVDICGFQTLKQNPTERPTVKALLQHPWLKQHESSMKWMHLIVFKTCYMHRNENHGHSTAWSLFEIAVLTGESHQLTINVVHSVCEVHIWIYHDDALRLWLDAAVSTRQPCMLNELLMLLSLMLCVWSMGNRPCDSVSTKSCKSIENKWRL